MAIINNSLTADESKVRLVNPIIYIPDPDKEGPLAGAQLFFGLVGRDPTLEENRKLVYALQEDNSAVQIAQPVICGAGGVPEYNGSNPLIAVAGSYSMAVLDSQGQQIYYFPHVEASNFQGFSGVIAEEAQTVAGGNTLTYSIIEATTASFYIAQSTNQSEFKGSFLRVGVDYTIDSATTIRLTAVTPDGTIVIGRQSDPTGQIVPVSEGASALFVFSDIAIAQAADLQLDDTVTINGGIVAGDNLGGNKYITVAAGTGVVDGENFITLNNGNQLKALSNNLKLARYAEVTTNISTVSGAINIDLNNGNVHKVTLTENVGAINFANINPDVTMTTTVTLKITQDAATPYTVNFGGARWAGGSVPVISTGLDAIDRFVFITDDGGVTWDGAVMGQDFQ